MDLNLSRQTASEQIFATRRKHIKMKRALSLPSTGRVFVYLLFIASNETARELIIKQLPWARQYLTRRRTRPIYIYLVYTNAVLLVVQAIWLVSHYDVIFTALGGGYKAKQNHCRLLGVLPKFQSENVLKTQEYPSVDDSGEYYS